MTSDVGQPATPGPDGPKPELPKAQVPEEQDKLGEAAGKFASRLKKVATRPLEAAAVGFLTRGSAVLDAVLGAIDEGEVKKKSVPKKRRKAP